jgi:hypothetical protein
VCRNTLQTTFTDYNDAFRDRLDWNCYNTVTDPLDGVSPLFCGISLMGYYIVFRLRLGPGGTLQREQLARVRVRAERLDQHEIFWPCRQTSLPDSRILFSVALLAVSICKARVHYGGGRHFDLHLRP